MVCLYRDEDACRRGCCHGLVRTVLNDTQRTNKLNNENEFRNGFKRCCVYVCVMFG